MADDRQSLVPKQNGVEKGSGQQPPGQKTFDDSFYSSPPSYGSLGFGSNNDQGQNSRPTHLAGTINSSRMTSPPNGHHVTDQYSVQHASSTATSRKEQRTVRFQVTSSQSQVFQARFLSTMVMILYMASNFGTSPLIAQYVNIRLMPEYINFSMGFNDKINMDMGPCSSANTSNPMVKAMSESMGALQKAVSNLMLYFSLAGTLPTIFTCVLFGTFSDVIGRRIMFFLPVTTWLLEAVMTAIIIKLELSLNYFYVINVVDGFGGSFTGLLMACFAYTADLTTPSPSRTLGIAIIEASFAIFGAAASVGVGYLIKYVNYFYAAIMMVGLAVIPFVLIFFLPETVSNHSPGLVRKGHREAEDEKRPSRNPLNYIKHIFEFYFTVGTLRRRAQFLLALGIFFIGILWFVGRDTVQVLYQMNAPFCWGSDDIGIYAGVEIFVRALGSVMAVRFLHPYMSDVTLVILALSTSVVSNIIYGSANSTFWLYLSIFVGVISNAATPVTRGILSKMAGPSKQGALFASIAVTETLCSLASSTMYNAVYSATVAMVPGAIFYMISGVIALNIVFAIIFKLISAGYPLVSEEHTTTEKVF